ncbi:extracellular solute-binding protein [Paenibacillus sp. FSL H8-0034]|uniref:extracellular solute-binding protein n=1 Tax=Paenibacillus sp. FSL H8-0034 TaxID=2954671 RepID=UPI0030F74055
MNVNNRLTSSAIVSSVILSLLAGCSTGNTNTTPIATTPSTTTPEGTAKQAPTKFSMMLPLYNTEAPAADSPLIKKVEEFANVKLDLNFVPSANYNDRVNISIASNELPQAITILDMKSPTFVNAVRSGMFWDVTSYLKSMPTFAKNYDPKLIANALTDGKNYGLPRGRPMARNAIIFRKDWLDKLGLQKPTNIDELYNVIKAFATKDPDGNGKDDTAGLLMGVDGSGNIAGYAFDVIVCMFGGGNNWELKDGKVVPTFMSEPYMNALKWVKKLYDEKLLNQDFAIVKGSEQVFELIDKERGGMYINNFSDAADRQDNLVKLVQQRNPALAGKSIADAKMDLIDTAYLIKSTDGTVRSPAQPGFNGVLAFPKTSVKTEAELKAILTAFDKLDTPEGQALIKWGIEGTHYTNQNGVPTVVGNTALVSKEVNTVWQMFLTNQVVDRSSIQGKSSPMTEKILKEQEDNLKNIVVDVSVPLLSATVSTNGTELTKIINTARIKYITGVIDDEGWKQAIDQWRKTGGDKVIQEYTEARAKLDGK